MQSNREIGEGKDEIELAKKLGLLETVLPCMKPAGSWSCRSFRAGFDWSLHHNLYCMDSEHRTTTAYHGRTDGTVPRFLITANGDIEAYAPRSEPSSSGRPGRREILPGWRVIAAGAYIDSEITQDSQPDFSNVDADGNPFGTNLRP